MKKLKALLINPPNTNSTNANLPEYIDEERGKLPPIGLLQVASYAKVNTD
jgi:hypothetical protein